MILAMYLRILEREAFCVVWYSIVLYCSSLLWMKILLNSGKLATFAQIKRLNVS